MLIIPLTYYSTKVGEATVDDDFELSTFYKFHLEIPRSIYQVYRRPDVIAAALRESPDIIQRCNPITTIQLALPYNLKLSRIVLLAPESTQILNEVVLLPRYAPRREALLTKLIIATRKFNRVIHEDGNRCNCCRGNLKFISVDDATTTPQQRLDEA